VEKVLCRFHSDQNDLSAPDFVIDFPGVLECTMNFVPWEAHKFLDNIYFLSLLWFTLVLFIRLL